MRILVRGGTVFTMTDRGILTEAEVTVEGGMVRAVGKAPRDWQPDLVVEAAGCAVLPGLINTHTHAAMTLLRGYADDQPLMPWLEEKIWPAEARLDGEDVYWGTLLAAVEMLSSGTTTFADMYFFMEEVGRAVSETGMRAVLSRGLIGTAPHAQEALAEGVDFARRWQGAAGGRIRTMLGPHAPYTCPPEYLRQVAQAARSEGVGVHIHLSETRGELEECRRLHGVTPVALLDQVGLLELPLLAAHCVHLASDDYRLLARTNVGVAHNPVSNLKLGSGVAPLETLLKQGVRVGLGTDGAASTNSLDLFQELRLAALLAKGMTGEPTAVTALQALELATTGGARALGLEGVIGRISPGYAADLITVDLTAPHLVPVHDPASALAYAATGRDVRTVLVDGRVVVERGVVRTVDVQRVCREVKQRAARLVAP